MQVAALLDWDFETVSGIIVTHFIQLLHSNLIEEPGVRLFLGHPTLVISYFRYRSSTQVIDKSSFWP